MALHRALWRMAGLALYLVFLALAAGACERHGVGGWKPLIAQFVIMCGRCVGVFPHEEKAIRPFSKPRIPHRHQAVRSGATVVSEGVAPAARRRAASASTALSTRRTFPPRNLARSSSGQPRASSFRCDGREKKAKGTSGSEECQKNSTVQQRKGQWPRGRPVARARQRRRMAEGATAPRPRRQRAAAT